ncbi:DUF4097 family beta strand repeat-containing protein [Nocardiopsis changdeensis]|uniref:DUF4097 family beta strand repeat-containing protein n=1 Tax=Nocardiopsis changdeensis TaxID=2831969 RepID=UPI003F481348
MEKFDTANPVSVVLDIPAGRVQIIAADRSDSTVEVRPARAGRGRDAKAAEQTSVTYDDGVLRILTPETGNRLLGPTGALEVTVQVPSGSRVEGRTGGAELRGVGRLGEVVFEGAYRQTKIDEAAALRLTVLDGDVEVGRLTGPAEIRTDRGDIRIDEAAAGAVVLRTGSGDISVTAAAGVSASLDAATGLGRIDNGLRNDGTAALDIRATTDMGDITARSL